ncbi:MAG TPA: c-type cytochrome domain-containing protein [Gemmataceae bacterium]|nr:c-type cytochrome domain-containing protein [Gemmataceae bacterium]
MMLRTALIVALLASLGGRASAEPPSYARQVKPFLARYCLECHNASTSKGDLDLETFKGMMQGGKSGAVVVPGKPDESRLVLLAEHKDKPPMPPKKARQPRPEEVAVLRSWVAAGAKNDSANFRITLPDIEPRRRLPPPITALTFSLDGKWLLAGEQHRVAVIDSAKGEVAGRLPTFENGKVTALRFSPDERSLAVAVSVPSVTGEIQFLSAPPHGFLQMRPERTVAGHKDAILDLAFSPDSKILASTGYDRLIKLWDVASGKELRTLKDHSDAVYGLAFSPDSRLLASCAADRAVKVWEVGNGKRLYTLGESTDWVYAVAWSPDGRRLAAGGVDKSIRVWEVTPTGGRIVQSVFGHEGAITRLLYSADGKTLYSLGEDRVVKAWDTARMVERRVYPKQPELVLTMALRPDQKQIALGRYDGAVIVLDEATGKVLAEPLPVRPKPPMLTKLAPAWGERGKAIRLTFEGAHLDNAAEVVATFPGVKAKFLNTGASSVHVEAEVTFPANTPAGAYKVSLKTPGGQTAPLPFIVDLFPAASEAGSHDAPRLAQRIALPATVVGSIHRAGDIDFYRFEAKEGQEIGVQATTAAIGSKLDPVLQLLDSADHVLEESTNGVLGHICQKTGVYVLSIRDREYRGGSQTNYRLHVGDIPVVTALYPLGIQRGTEQWVRLQGVNLGTHDAVRVKVPADAAPGSRVPVPITTPKGAPLGEAGISVGEFPEAVSAGNMAAWAMTENRLCIRLAPPGTTCTLCLPVPGTANGRIYSAGVTESWRFTAKKGQPLILEVNARRLGSPLDSTIEILDAKDQPVPRAMLRCAAKTYVTFRDHDSAGPNIRLEAWSEFAMNDYVWVGNELLRIWELPKNPDDDCLFYSLGGRRQGFLDTTPGHVPMGAAMYKVAIHLPGATFSPNGFPVISLPYRNDDGGPGYGKDSRLVFDPPSDGEYQVRIGDARGQGGSNYAYRLTVRPPRPDFTVSFSPTSPAVWKGSAVPITVSANRSDGFEGPIEVRVENVPAGFSAPVTTIPAGENSTTLAFWADPAAKTPQNVPPLKVSARARINGQDVVREAPGGLPRVMEPGDLTTTTEQSEVSVKPGQQVWLTTKIERRNKFKGRVPLEVRGLPHGVRVLDIGLNGILITEKESTRTFAIYAEPWVEPMTQPFVVLARNEGKGTEYAARSVLLKIIPAAK